MAELKRSTNCTFKLGVNLILGGVKQITYVIFLNKRRENALNSGLGTMHIKLKINPKIFTTSRAVRQ